MFHHASPWTLVASKYKEISLTRDAVERLILFHQIDRSVFEKIDGRLFTSG